MCGILLTTAGRKWSADCVFAPLFPMSVLLGPMNYFITDEDIMDKVTPSPNTNKESSCMSPQRLAVLDISMNHSFNFIFLLLYRDSLSELRFHWCSFFPGACLCLSPFFFFNVFHSSYTILFKLFNIYLFICLHRVLVAARGLLSCSSWAP